MDINELKQLSEQVLDLVSEKISSMKEDQRIKMADLSEDISSQLGVNSDTILPIINYFIENSGLAYKARGRNGGVVKGQKPEKASEKTKVVATGSPLTDKINEIE